MKGRGLLRMGALLIGVELFVGRPDAGLAQTNAPAESAELAAQERAACTKNLKVIYDAIQAYKNDNKDLPNWLSDLVPQYLTDANVLICPVCLRTGNLETPETSDPKIATSYDYQFVPAPLGNSLPNAPDKTRREWKQRQLALVGPIVPLVRCRHHGQILNLACDGKIYESGTEWELLITNGVKALDLRPAQMFAASVAPPAPKKPLVTAEKPATTDSITRTGPVNLSRYYNAGISNSWLGGEPNDDLSTLKPSKHTYAGINFENKGGLIQVGGKSLTATNYTNVVRSIRVRRICQTLNFLHGAVFGTVQDEGQRIGTYTVYYATNQMRLEIPIYYGKDVRNWHPVDDEPPAPTDLKLGWSGQNGAGKPTRLFVTTWTNIAPAVEIDRIDFRSSMAGPAPFLLGLSTE